jgi:hypothetical protein
VAFVRVAYQQIARQKEPLMIKLAAHLDVPVESIMHLHVDPQSSTLFVYPEWSTRLGVFVVKEKDLPKSEATQ